MKEQITQKMATYNAIKSVLITNGISFEDGMDAKEVLTPDLKKEVRIVLFEGFKSGSIVSSEKFTRNKLNIDSELNKYCTELISNWTRKDKRLNGNIKYIIKKPGSKVGYGDKKVKELRKLLKQVIGTEHESEVKKALDERVAIIKETKVPKVIINVEALPEHLRYLVK